MRTHTLKRKKNMSNHRKVEHGDFFINLFRSSESDIWSQSDSAQTPTARDNERSRGDRKYNV